MILKSFSKFCQDIENSLKNITSSSSSSSEGGTKAHRLDLRRSGLLKGEFSPKRRESQNQRSTESTGRRYFFDGVAQHQGEKVHSFSCRKNSWKTLNDKLGSPSRLVYELLFSVKDSCFWWMVEKVNNSRGTIPFNIFSGSAVGLTSKVGRSPSIDTSPRKKSDEIDHPPEDNVC